MRYRWMILVVLLFCGCREEIVHDLNEREANKLVGNLHRVMIDAEKTQQPDGLWSISVAEYEKSRSLRFLAATRALRRTEPTKRSNSLLMATREDQRFSRERSLSVEIENTLVGIDGVLDARVHLHLPPTDPVFGQSLPGKFDGSGSVLLVMSQEASIDESQAAQLVAGACGLSPGSISVLINRVNLRELSTGSEVVTAERQDSSATEEQKTAVGLSSLQLLQVQLQRSPFFSLCLAAVLLLVGLARIVAHRLRSQ